MPQRGHALAAVLAAAMPVAVSLVVCQAPSLLQAHKVEELALVLWGGWAIGALGGAAQGGRGAHPQRSFDLSCTHCERLGAALM